jgi:hypothetical protein
MVIVWAERPEVRQRAAKRRSMGRIQCKCTKVQRLFRVNQRVEAVILGAAQFAICARNPVISSSSNQRKK